MSASPVSNQTVQSFWQENPVAARHTKESPGTYEYFRRLDNLREGPDCEPYAFAEKIHGFSQSHGLRVLDVGCGHGYVLHHYARHGAEVHGIDLTPKAREICQRRFAMTGLDGTFAATDGKSIPYPDAHFDVVCSMGVLHHVSDPAPMIAEIARVLRPGGRLILMLYHKDSFRNHVTFRWRKYFGPPLYRGKDLQAIRNMNDGPGCPLALVYSREEAAALLAARFTDLRFHVNKLSYEEVFLFSRAGGILARLLPNPSEGPLARRWGWNLYIQGRKA